MVGRGLTERPEIVNVQEDIVCTLARNFAFETDKHRLFTALKPWCKPRLLSNITLNLRRILHLNVTNNLLALLCKTAYNSQRDV